MRRANRFGLIAVSLLGIMLSAAVPAFAQVDFTGVWNPQRDEDAPERGPRP